MVILNLTQHNATREQMLAGVEEPPEAVKELVAHLLTFEEVPGLEDLRAKARALAEIARVAKVQAALVGGAPFFMPFLERALLQVGIEPVYAFSRRVSTEETQPDGTVRKVSSFRHIGFVRPYAAAKRWTVVPMSPSQLSEYMVGNGMDCFAASALIRSCQ